MWYDFLLKILLTTFTIGVGFKGGEVTPLFFVGATLGSFLSMFLPLPMSLMAAMGFVAVFSGATNTPIACTSWGLSSLVPKGDSTWHCLCDCLSLLRSHQHLHGPDDRQPETQCFHADEGKDAAGLRNNRI